MSFIAVYPLGGFSMYLMPKTAAPVCPPCQSDVLPSVFEDDDEDEFQQDPGNPLQRWVT
jgi:hypothetical protein